jgi:hypothetical protein
MYNLGCLSVTAIWSLKTKAQSGSKQDLGYQHYSAIISRQRAKHEG